MEWLNYTRRLLEHNDGRYVAKSAIWKRLTPGIAGIPERDLDLHIMPKTADDVTIEAATARRAWGDAARARESSSRSLGPGPVRRRTAVVDPFGPGWHRGLARTRRSSAAVDGRGER